MAKSKKRPKNKPGYKEILLDQREKVDKLIIFFLLAVIALVPLITRMVVFPHIAPTIMGNVLDTGMKGDAFTYLKMKLLIFIVIIIVLLFLYKMIFLKYRIKQSFINLPTAVLFVFILLSCLFASYSSVATNGIYTRHEGTLTYIMYLTLFFIAANIEIKEKYLNYFVYALFPLVLINSVLGLLDFYGIDVLKNSVISALAISPEVKQYLTEGSALSTTINNPNYVSGIASVIFMIFLVRFLFSKKIRETVMFYIFLLLTFVMLLVSTSTSGFLTLMVVIPFALVPAFQRSKIKETLIKTAVLLGSLVPIYMLLNSHNQAVYANTLGFSPYILAIPLVMAAIVIGLRNKRFIMGMTMFAAVVLVGGVLTISGVITGPGFNQSGQIPQSTSTMSPASMIPDENGVLNLPSYGSGLGSGRIYLWAQTLKLIKDKPVLGYGLDTIGYYYPHYDIKSISNLSGVLVDKPHNMYLALAFGSGIPALLAFLVIILLYLKKNLFLYAETINGHRKVMILCILGGCLAYLFQGIFNDSIIGTAPIFWIIFGIGVSLLSQEQTAEK